MASVAQSGSLGEVRGESESVSVKEKGSISAEQQNDSRVGGTASGAAEVELHNCSSVFEGEGDALVVLPVEDSSVRVGGDGDLKGICKSVGVKWRGTEVQTSSQCCCNASSTRVAG